VQDTAYVARLRNYKSVIDYIRQVTSELDFDRPGWRGVN